MNIGHVCRRHRIHVHTKEIKLLLLHRFKQCIIYTFGNFYSLVQANTWTFFRPKWAARRKKREKNSKRIQASMSVSFQWAFDFNLTVVCIINYRKVDEKSISTLITTVVEWCELCREVFIDIVWMNAEICDKMKGNCTGAATIQMLNFLQN